MRIIFVSLLLIAALGLLTYFLAIPANNETIVSDNTQPATENALTTTEDGSRAIEVISNLNLPLPGSTPSVDVPVSIPVSEIRQGCFRQDCIPSVDEPVFVSVSAAREVLAAADSDIGIALSYNGVDRFYPFAMLATREIVNDTIAGDPVLVTYCPLCGTGIVYERRVDGEAVEFGVSGMLWQSNLLMYNRAESVSDRNLWSQVLGQAVVGKNTGDRLPIVASDIMSFAEWAAINPTGQVLDTGSVRDPYAGEYYRVARQFSPSFDERTSPLDPSEYVYGIERAGVHKAYPATALPVGETSDVVGGEQVVITKSPEGTVTFTDESGTILPDVEGFWFSWAAAHPNTLLWHN
ncbi:DUF3179 domain-containing protein [Candidatus Pacebacteria bacterium]|nr:DUF3179 domain-containing protein [Candidatus Paceibacterota bacterium]